jgi:hypothetical protein
MLFVADQMPAELRRIVEFLNEQMDPAEILALELRQFTGEGLKTIVPTVYGQTEEARKKKETGAPKREWNEESVLAGIGSRVGAEAQHTAQRIAQWMGERADQVWFGSGNQYGSMGITIVANSNNYYPLAIWTNGLIEIRFQYLLKGPFESEERRRELLERLNKIGGISLPPNSITLRPSIPMAMLSGEAREDSFLQVMDWLVGELRAS